MNNTLAIIAPDTAWTPIFEPVVVTLFVVAVLLQCCMNDHNHNSLKQLYRADSRHDDDLDSLRSRIGALERSTRRLDRRVNDTAARVWRGKKEAAAGPT